MKNIKAPIFFRKMESAEILASLDSIKEDISVSLEIIMKELTDIKNQINDLKT